MVPRNSNSARDPARERGVVQHGHDATTYTCGRSPGSYAIDNIAPQELSLFRSLYREPSAVKSEANTLTHARTRTHARTHTHAHARTSCTIRLPEVTVPICVVFLSFIWCSNDDSQRALSVSDLAITITLPLRWVMRKVCSCAILAEISLGSRASSRPSRLKLGCSFSVSARGGNV